MTAPGPTHERLRVDLDALAVLTGHREHLRLGDWLRPDVARCDLLDLRLFVGDAKDSEGPTKPDSLRRLRTYLAAVAQATRLGWTATVAVAHAHPDAAWLAQLEWFAARFGLTLRHRGVRVIAADATISWIGVAASTPSAVGGAKLAL